MKRTLCALILLISGCGTTSHKNQDPPNSNIITYSSNLASIQPQITNKQKNLARLVYSSAEYINDVFENNFQEARNYILKKFKVDLNDYEDKNKLYNTLFENRDGSLEDEAFLLSYQINIGIDVEENQKKLRQIGY